MRDYEPISVDLERLGSGHVDATIGLGHHPFCRVQVSCCLSSLLLMHHFVNLPPYLQLPLRKWVQAGRSDAIDTMMALGFVLVRIRVGNGPVVVLISSKVIL